MKNILKVLIAILLIFTLGACSEVGYIADNTEHYDTITNTLKLTKSYEGKSFLTDGIGKATVISYTDGDTTRFRLEQGDDIVIRYHSVDTRESTGDVEKWGKAASNFTKEQLKKAVEVVLEAPGDRAEHDSYGVRYLGYVWYRESTSADFKCLNLELVENGYSENTGVNTSKYPYYEYFDKAQKFAESIKLRLYSDLDDPLFTTDPIPITIKEFKDNPQEYFNEDADSGSKVIFTAYLESVHTSSSGTYTYIASEIGEDNQKYSINVYAGYASSAASTMPLGHLYVIVGRIAKYSGAYQISGINYNPIYEVETHIVQRDYFVTFNSKVAYDSRYSSSLYSNITVTEVAVEENTIKFKGTTQQVTSSGLKEEVKTFSFSVTKPENYSGEIQVGAVISTQAYQFTAKSGEFTILQYSNLKINN